MVTKPSNPKGTRDFSSEDLYRRNYLFGLMTEVFQRYGFQPIETPAMENLISLTGKYGEEGDQLLFKVLNNGDFLDKVPTEILTSKDSKAAAAVLSKRGLRYDLTVPFARYVSQHQAQLVLPFKRYQIQPVWRADRPQKGRYQEFYQCDCDVVGSESLVYEAELVEIYDGIFSALQLPVQIRLNNRKVLMGIAEMAGLKDRFFEMTVIIDKIDKIQWAGVAEEMRKKEYTPEQISLIEKSLQCKSLEELALWLAPNSEEGRKGCEELGAVFSYLNSENLVNEVVLDVSLARGLSYYTGCIFEVVAKDVQMGSLGGGGRYADLTGSFGLKDVSGVGISFGAERIFDVLQELNLFPQNISRDIQLLLLSYDNLCLKHAFQWAGKLRRMGLRVDIYPEAAKMNKQFKYANARKVPYTVVLGPEEINQGVYALKDMRSGEQWQKTEEEIIAFFKESE
jgi:histidyl-tRNA synthetase